MQLEFKWHYNWGDIYRIGIFSFWEWGMAFHDEEGGNIHFTRFTYGCFYYLRPRTYLDELEMAKKRNALKSLLEWHSCKTESEFIEKHS